LQTFVDSTVLVSDDDRAANQRPDRRRNRVERLSASRCYRRQESQQKQRARTHPR
jgi:hypothetical protein